MVVSLIHDAQEIAILSGKEVLNLETLNEAYKQRLSMLHGFIQPGQRKQTSKVKKKASADSMKGKVAVDSMKLPVAEDSSEFTIAGLVSMAKDEDMDIVQLLKEHLPVTEVAI